MKSGRLIIVLFLVIGLVLPALGAEYKGLKPGVSTKADADRVLGAPIREITKGVRYDYPVADEDALRVSISFAPGSLVIKTIDLYQADLYDKAQYRKWFNLEDPAKSETDAQGRLVEYYPAQGIALHFLGEDPSSPVEYFSHFDPRRLGGGASAGGGGGGEGAAPAPQAVAVAPEAWLSFIEGELLKEAEGSALYYVILTQKAAANHDCPAWKALIDKSLEEYPETAEFWRLKFNYLRSCNQPPYKDVEDEIGEAAEKAFDLDPSPQNAFNLGWLCHVLGRNYGNALVWYTLANRDATFKDPNVFLYMAQCHDQLGRHGEAASYYERFLKTVPDHPQAGEAQKRLDELKLRR
jgi:tetratricopeptide (TPR) repeat protein